MTNAEAEMETLRLFNQWLPQWKAENPDKEKPTGNNAFFGFYLGVLQKQSSPIITPNREWQDVHSWLRGRGCLDG